jgi:hypothetical protein
MIYLLFMCVFLARHRGALAVESASCLACGGNGEYSNAVYILNESLDASNWCFDVDGNYKKDDEKASIICHSRGADDGFYLRCVCPTTPALTARGNVKCRTCFNINEKVLFTIEMLSQRFFCLDPDTRDRQTTLSSGTECGVDIQGFGDLKHPLYNQWIVNVVQNRLACECS